MKGAIIAVGGLISVGLLGFGVLSVMAGGMSDNISAGRDAVNSGFWMAGLGLAGIVACVLVGIFL